MVMKLVCKDYGHDCEFIAEGENVEEIMKNFGKHSGLGLNIVKNIIELHGGSIIASNQAGHKKGAKIEVLLPISK